MRLSRLICIAAIFAASPTPAFAYLDPGTGSMILQALLGAVAVGAASVSVFWHRVKSFFSPGSKSVEHSHVTEQDTPKR